MPHLEPLGVNRATSRPLFMLGGADPSVWDVSSDQPLGLFTALLALDADRYSNELISGLARSLGERGLGWLCAWGPGCRRVDALFDEEYIADASTQGNFLMTTDHAGESLAEALWFAIDLAIPEKVKDVRDSAVVIGVDDPRWREEVLVRTADIEELRRHVAADPET
jgi:hypothetical protein